ncbi:hypothetical protein EVAR_43665_1 [Eumeta japonica]|uniref:Uncharacterized protein n=1 Tax=Eumeta variegata TaxID=151549 RepID=A0A4C1XWD5_EUMVA|nr:hypothetical protein EVAR_43665_1 [Eumeta japonica]
MAISTPPRKPELWISFTVTSEYGFLRCVGKMMDSVSMFRLVYCSTSLISGGQSSIATDALFFVVLPLRKGSKHLGIEGHVKFTARTENFKVGLREAREPHRVDDLYRL